MVITSLATAGTALAVGGLLLAACSAGPSGAAGTTPSTSSTSTPRPTRTVTVTVTVTPTPTPIPTSPQAYTQDFVTAWVQRDRASADELAIATAVQTAFAHHLANAPVFQRCEGAAGSSYCTFDGAGYTVIVRVLNDVAHHAQPHAVREVRYSTS